MPRRYLVLLAVLIVGMAGLGTYLAGGSKLPAGSDGAPPSLKTCDALEANSEDQNACFALAVLEGLENEGPAYVDALDKEAEQYRNLGPRCHVLMHDVADLYARNHKVTPDNLKDNLPESGNVNCAAGLTHGMMTAALANTSEVSPLGGIVAVCRSESTRIKQINCVHGLGHAFMRRTKSDVDASLAQCARLGLTVAPDCAPGVFHDYFFGLTGIAGAAQPSKTDTDPRTLCAKVAESFVRPCWLRAVQFSVPPDNPPLQDVRPAIAKHCAKLEATQRDGCIAGYGFLTDPAGLDTCFLLSRADAQSCLYGNNSDPTDSEVLAGCAGRPAATRDLCFIWFGRLHGVYADPLGDTSFCDKLPAGAGRTGCLAGAKLASEPLGGA